MGDLVTARDLAAPSDSLGRYRLLGVLGQGNRATFHLGISGGIGLFKKLVVVKELRPEFGGESKAVEQFLAEAKLAARLNHPNVVHALEADSDGGRPFLALEFLDGQSLKEAWKRNLEKRSPEKGGLSLAVQLRILCEVLTGLHHAHQLCDYDGRELQVVHGDVRPENVFVTYDGQVKVMNFGTPRVYSPSGTFDGRLAYAAPEQVRRRPSVRQTDVFAVGVMLWEVLAGKSFTADPTDPAALKARLFGLEPRVSEVVPEAPHGLANICNRAMAVDPADRYSTAEDFRDALIAFLRASGEVIDARTIGAQIRALFEPERAAMHRIIESALSIEEEPASSARSSPERETPHEANAATVASLPPLALEPEEDDGDEDEPTFRSRRPALVAALAATALAAAGGFWFGMSPLVNQQSGAAATAPPGVASAIVVPSAAESVELPPEPVAVPAAVESAAPVPAVESAAPVPAVESAAPVPAVESAAPVPAVESAAPVPAVESAAPVPAVESAAPVPAVESAAPVPAVESAAPVPSPAPSASAQRPRQRPRTQKVDEPEPPTVSPDNPYE